MMSSRARGAATNPGAARASARRSADGGIRRSWASCPGLARPAWESSRPYRDRHATRLEPDTPSRRSGDPEVAMSPPTHVTARSVPQKNNAVGDPPSPRPRHMARNSALSRQLSLPLRRCAAMGDRGRISEPLPHRAPAPRLARHHQVIQVATQSLLSELIEKLTGGRRVDLDDAADDLLPGQPLLYSSNRAPPARWSPRDRRVRTPRDLLV